MEISLADFVDFTTRTGSSRVAKVRELKTRDRYDPATDFWRGLREGIVGLQRRDQMSGTNLDKLVDRASPRKARPYGAASAGYKKMIGRRKVVWFEPKSAIWRARELEVRVNPELGLRFDGRDVLAKLYMKKDAVTRAGIQAVLAMMELELRGVVAGNVEFGVIDAQAGRLHVIDGRWAMSDMETSLVAESLAFEEIWRRI